MTVPEAVPAEGAPERAPAATTPAAGTEPAARTLPAAATLPPAGRVVLTGTLPQGGPAGEAPPVATAGETAGREPALPLFVYDGDCGFCTASASWIGRRLRVPVRVAPWQSLDLAALGLVEADVTSAAYWIDEAGSRHRGAAGVARAL